MNATDIELAYAAGVLDSDGCIRVHRDTWRARNSDCVNPTYQAVALVRQVETEAIDWFHQMFGGYRTMTTPTAKRGRPLHSWSVHSQAAGRVLMAVLPYLRIKHRQAENALEVCRLSKLGSRRFEVPPVKDGEPLVSMAEAAERLGTSYAVVLQAVHRGSVPFVRRPAAYRQPHIFIPESYLEVWRTRGQTPSRSAEVNARLEACFQRGKELNRVGV
jgi:hypothetical protein